MVTYKLPPKHYTISDADSLEQMALNAARAGKEEAWFQIMRIRCRLERRIARDPLDIEFRRTLKAYELILSKKNRRKTRAIRTRMAYDNRGAKAVLEKWALANKEVHSGFEVLVAHGEYELTGEYLVLRAKKRFAPEVCRAARSKLLAAQAPIEILKKADANQLPDYQ